MRGSATRCVSSLPQVASGRAVSDGDLSAAREGVRDAAERIGQLHETVQGVGGRIGAVDGRLAEHAAALDERLTRVDTLLVGLDEGLTRDVERLLGASGQQVDAAAELRAQLAPRMEELGQLVDRLPDRLDDAVGGAARDPRRSAPAALRCTDLRPRGCRRAPGRPARAGSTPPSPVCSAQRARLRPRARRSCRSCSVSRQQPTCSRAASGVALGDFREATAERADAHQRRLDTQLDAAR